jgi:hypothetical protein
VDRLRARSRPLLSQAPPVVHFGWQQNRAFVGSGRLVRCRTGPTRRLVIADPEYPIHTISTFCAEHQRATPRMRWRSSDRRRRPPRIVDDAASPRRRHRPAVSTAIRIQPSGHLTKTAAESCRWNADPDPYGKPPLGVAGRLLRGPHRASRMKSIRRSGGRESRSRRSRPVISTLPSSVNCRRRTFRSAINSSRVRCRW